MRGSGIGVEEEREQFDEQFIKDLAMWLKDVKGYHYTDIARKIVGVTGFSSSWLGRTGKRFFQPDHKVTLEEVGRLAHELHKPAMELLKIVKPIHTSNGAFSTTVIQSGDRSEVHAANAGLAEAIDILKGLTPEQINALSSLQDAKKTEVN